MNNVSYNSEVVNGVIDNIRKISNNIPSLSSEIKRATSKLISSKGFSKYVSGISSDTFSAPVDKTMDLIKCYVNEIQQKQVSILAYSKDKDEINTFLNGLSREDYNTLDLTELDSYIGFDRKVENVFKGIGATATTFGLGLLEGIGNLLETGADLVILGASGAATLFTGAVDLITGSNLTKDLWEETRAIVSEKPVENIFNSLYNNTEFGQEIKNNAYGFDLVRGIGTGAGYTLGIIGLSVVTGGLSSGLGIGAKGSITPALIAKTAGLFGFSSATEDAWNDGATTENGLLYGAVSGAWTAGQWYLGAKINQYGGLGDKIAKGIFKGAAKGVTTRIAMDTGVAAFDAAVQPALTMIYKDYGKGSFLENYSAAFEKAGGLTNVGTQALFGAMGSAIGEFVGARKLLKAANQVEGGDGGRHIFEGDNFDEYGSPRDYTLDNLKKSTDKTIDGDYIHPSDNAFNTKTASQLPDSFKWFKDGSYIPDADSIAKQALMGYEDYMTPQQARELIENCKSNLSGDQYTKLMKTVDIFESSGTTAVSANELKLIAFHSDGNVGRITSTLEMSYSKISDSSTIEDLATKLSKEVFPTDQLTPGATLKRNVVDNYITSLRSSGVDDWKSTEEIIKTIDTDNLIKNVSNTNADELLRRIKNNYGSQIPSDVAIKIANCDGYPSTIQKILVESDLNLDSNTIRNMSLDTSSNIFYERNLARVKAVDELSNLNMNKALQLTSGAGATYEGYRDLLQSSTYISEEGGRRAYYSIIDNLVDQGYTQQEAVKHAKIINGNALNNLGMDSSFIDYSSSSPMYRWNSQLDNFDNSPLYSTPKTNYIKKKYTNILGTKVDEKRIVDDFTNMMQKKMNGMTTEWADRLSKELKVDVDIDYSKKAVKSYSNMLVSNATDTSNPNRREALRVMSVLMEQEENGNGITIFSQGGAHGPNANSHGGKLMVQLDPLTIRDGVDIISAHESAHTLSQLGNPDPIAGYDSARQRALNNIESGSFSDTLRMFEENNAEAKYYSDYLVDKRLDEALKKKNFNGVQEYRNYLADKYQQMSLGERIDYLRDWGQEYGGMDLRRNNTEKMPSLLDNKNVEQLADIQITSLRRRIAEKVNLSDSLLNTTMTSRALDCASFGQFGEGHGAKYYMRNPKYALRNSYQEQLADYVALRISGKNSTIRYLRGLFGNELYDKLEEAYQRMIK